MGNVWSYRFRLVGPGGEPIDLWRTIQSHGLASLPPMRIDEERRTVELTLRLSETRARTVRIEAADAGWGRASAAGRLSTADEAKLTAAVRHALRLDEDLSPFYALAARDPDLAWVTAGAGRMMRGATVFEDVVKTLCTTNCAWSATVRMVERLVERLGTPAQGALTGGPHGRAFPSPAAMAGVNEAFYREVVRAGYRAKSLRTLATTVAAGEVELEGLASADPEAVSDDEIERRLLALPGVGPYAATHIMTLIGRYSRPILDSWTRPTYARLVGAPATDAEITTRFAPYGRWAGLAFWLVLTREWVADEAPIPAIS